MSVAAPSSSTPAPKIAIPKASPLYAAHGNIGEVGQFGTYRKSQKEIAQHNANVERLHKEIETHTANTPKLGLRGRFSQEKQKQLEAHNKVLEEKQKQLAELNRKGQLLSEQADFHKTQLETAAAEDMKKGLVAVTSGFSPEALAEMHSKGNGSYQYRLKNIAQQELDQLQVSLAQEKVRLEQLRRTSSPIEAQQKNIDSQEKKVAKAEGMIKRREALIAKYDELMSSHAPSEESYSVGLSGSNSSSTNSTTSQNGDTTETRAAKKAREEKEAADKEAAAKKKAEEESFGEWFGDLHWLGKTALAIPVIGGGLAILGSIVKWIFGGNQQQPQAA